MGSLNTGCQRGWLAVTLALTFGGCSGLGVASSPPPADPNLYPAKYRVEIADFLRRNLENPTKIRGAFISEPTLKPVGGAPRYVACVRYTPRDSKDRYQKAQEKTAIFWAGRLNQFLDIDTELCGNAAYQRFPEAEVLVP